MSINKVFHEKIVSLKRMSILSEEISQILPKEEFNKSWLDIGSGDGRVTHAIYNLNKRLFSVIKTVDIFHVENPFFEYVIYNGRNLPFSNNSFDIISLIDVLHHSQDIEQLLVESKRVTKKYILIKDHKYNKNWQKISLKFQDWFGNFGTECPLEYNFLRYNEWEKIFKKLRLKNLKFKHFVNYKYPFFLNVVFPKELHFICLLEKIN